MSDSNSNDKFGKILSILKYVAIGYIIVNVIAFASGVLGFFDKSGLGNLINKALAFFGDLLDNCRIQGVCNSNYQKTAKECTDANCDWQEAGAVECSDPDVDYTRLNDCVDDKDKEDCCCGVDCDTDYTNKSGRCVYKTVTDSGESVSGCYTYTNQSSACTYKPGRPEGSGGTFTPKCFLLYLVLVPSILAALFLLFLGTKLWRWIYSNQDKDAKNLSALTGEKVEDIIKRWAEEWEEGKEESSEKAFEDTLEVDDKGELKFNLRDALPFDDDKRLEDLIDKKYSEKGFTDKKIIEAQKNRIKELRKTLRRQRFIESKYKSISKSYSKMDNYNDNIKNAGENYTKAAKEITKMVDKSKHMSDEDKKTIKEQTDTFKDAELDPKK